MITLIRFAARVLIGLLWIRFALKLLSVTASGIVATIYDISAYVIAPFRGIFPNIQIGQFVIESNTLLAIVVIALIEFLLIKILHATSHDEDY